MCEYFYSSGCFSATLIPNLSWYSTSVNSVILNQASKLLHLSEIILQCSTLTKDQYPVRVPAASSLESSATPTHCTALPMLLLTVSWLPATSHELQKKEIRDCIVSYLLVFFTSLEQKRWTETFLGKCHLLSSKYFRANDKTSKIPVRINGQFQPSLPQVCNKWQNITPSRWAAVTPELSHGICLLISPAIIACVCPQRRRSFLEGMLGPRRAENPHTSSV